MTTEQIEIVVLLALTVAAFIADRWRYDIVALTSLFVAVVIGLVPAGKAFTGFSSPVVITVGAVLVMSAAVSRSGAVDAVLKLMSRFSERKAMQIVILCGLCMGFSAFMNNVGALAIFLPITLAVARKSGRTPSELLMPLSFSSLLGGLMTLIGTPPNLLIAEVREKYADNHMPYEMFDFFPVGGILCLAGIAYLAVGWRLLPSDRRGKPMPEDQFAIEDYVTEMRLIEGATVIGKTVREMERLVETDFSIIGLIRGGNREAVPPGRRKLMQNDILMIKSDSATIKIMVDTAKVELVANKDAGDLPVSSDDVGIVEAVVRAESELIDSTPKQLRLRSRYGVNILATRQTSSHRVARRLSDTKFKEGDIIILQGELDAMPEILEELGCLPLAERNLQLGRKNMKYVAPAILCIAVALTIAGVLPVEIAFLGGALTVALLRVLRLNEVYDAIDGPVLVLLAALIPVTDAMEKTGATDLMATWLAQVSHGLPGYLTLAMVLVSTMAVTPFLNNAATVLLMGPIAAGLAKNAGYDIDPFLMAVAIGASCDFLTPVGHQSNTLVMGPGGYKFTDYWRLGLPLSIMIVVLGVPVLMWFWPLHGGGH